MTGEAVLATGSTSIHWHRRRRVRSNVTSALLFGEAHAEEVPGFQRWFNEALVIRTGTDTGLPNRCEIGLLS